MKRWFWLVVVLVLPICPLVAQTRPPVTKASPPPAPVPPIQVTVVAPEKSPKEKAQEDSQREREVEAQESVARFTRILTWLAFIQAVITGVALAAAVRAANAAKNSADAANDSVKLARHSAAIALAQKRIGDKQLRQIEEQIEIARIGAEATKQSADTATLALHLTECADLALERIEADTIGDELIAAAQVTVWVKNRGRTRATSVMFDGSLGVPGGNEMPKENAPPMVISAGDEQPFRFTHSLGGHIPGDVLTQINHGELQLRITGLLTYKDIFDKPHSLRFQGHWNRAACAFSPDLHESD